MCAKYANVTCFKSLLRGGGGRGGEGICPYIIYADGVGVIFRFFVYLMLWGGGWGGI